MAQVPSLGKFLSTKTLTLGRSDLNSATVRDSAGPKHFLIVENDADDAMLIKMGFEAANCGSSFICRNVGEAKAYLRGAGMYGDRNTYPLPDAVLTDLKMGDESGIDLARWIKAEKVLAGVPIVILSGEASPAEMEEAESLNIYAVYRKPRQVEQFKDLIARLTAELCF